MTGDTKRFGALSGDKKRLLQKLRATRADAGPATTDGPAREVRPIARNEPLPLSFGQERLWWIQQVEPHNASYNIAFGLHLEGPLDVSALRVSLSELAARHEVLRTRYEIHAGRPIAIIDPSPGLGLLEEVQQAALSEQELVTEMARYGRRPFDLERGPVFRARLLAVGPGRHVLLFNMHHIAGDQWSIGVLQRELVASYAACLAGGSADLPPLPYHYVDYASWQREEHERGAYREQIAHFKQRLARAPAFLETILDRPRPVVGTYTGDRVPLSLGAELTRRVAALAQQTGTTPFLVLLAALYALFARISGQRDLTIGTPIANRSVPGSEGLVGFFANTLALRVDLEGDPQFDELLSRVRQTAFDAYANQDAPFDRIVEALNPGRTASRSPVFQVMFAFENAALPMEALGALVVQPLSLPTAATAFDLILALAPAPDLEGFFDYSTDVFHRETIERLALGFTTLVDVATSQPSLRLSDLPAVAPSDVETIATPADLPTSRVQLVHERFVEQASRRPEAPALSFGLKSLTYAELDSQSRRLSGYLAELGVRRGDRVVVFLDRSIESIVAVLAIHRVGAAYVPVDVRNPDDRIAFMLADTQPAAVLTHSSLRARLRANCQVVLLDEPIEGEPADPMWKGLGPDDAAYAIYTSGSTGMPKSVVVGHGALANVVSCLVELLDIQPSDRVMQFVSLGFDVSASEIFMALGAGATLVLARQEGLLPGSELTVLLRQLAVTIVSMPASVLTALDPAPMPALRALIVGGEPCPQETVRKWNRGRRMFNCYGPTEATICATYTEVTERAEVLGIGQPIANVHCQVLDAHGAPAPIGVAGELAIGGVGVARGYAGRPDLTAARFVPDPFAASPGARMYLSGDIARWRSDGNIDFLGRADHQVKIRGHRVELTECENVLLQHAAVADASVVARDVSGGRHLVAYVVPRAADPGDAELREHVKRKLPEYMVPSVFVSVPSLPRTSSGKLDRQALPEPDLRALRGGLATARDDVEQRLVTIWEKILGVSPIGVTDNYFDVGGNSFLIMRLITEVQDVFGLSLPLSVVLDEGTIEHMAAVLRARMQAPTARALVTMRAGGSKAPVFFIHPVGGNVLCYGRLARLIERDRAVYGFQARGADDDLPARDDMYDMARSYGDELVARVPEGPFALVGWSLGGTVAFEMARQLRERGRQVGLLCLLDATAPFASDRLVSDAELMATLVRDFGGLFGISAPSLEGLRSASAEQLEQVAIDHVRQAGLFPAGKEREAIQRFGRLYRAHMNAHLRYRPRLYDGDMLFMSARSSQSTRHLVERWSAVTLGSFEEIALKAVAHTTMLLQPHVVIVAEELNHRLGPLDG